jgi:hypothetical protein
MVKVSAESVDCSSAVFMVRQLRMIAIYMCHGLVGGTSCAALLAGDGSPAALRFQLRLRSTAYLLYAGSKLRFSPCLAGG